MLCASSFGHIKSVWLYYCTSRTLLSARKSPHKPPYFPHNEKTPLPNKTTRPEMPMPPFADCDCDMSIIVVIMIGLSYDETTDHQHRECSPFVERTFSYLKYLQFFTGCGDRRTFSMYFTCLTQFADCDCDCDMSVRSVITSCSPCFQQSPYFPHKHPSIINHRTGSACTAICWLWLWLWHVCKISYYDDWCSTFGGVAERLNIFSMFWMGHLLIPLYDAIALI